MCVATTTEGAELMVSGLEHSVDIRFSTFSIRGRVVGVSNVVAVSSYIL